MQNYLYVQVYLHLSPREPSAKPSRLFEDFVLRSWHIINRCLWAELRLSLHLNQATEPTAWRQVMFLVSGGDWVSSQEVSTPDVPIVSIHCAEILT